MTTIVFGHKSPDTDSTGSPIIWAWYLSDVKGTPAEPRLLGEPNTEAAFVLERWNLDKPQIIDSVAADTPVVIVDTNNPAELPDAINDADFRAIIDRAYSVFGHAARAQMVQLEQGHFLLELFHGPTLAFKDFGARFMARTMSWFLQQSPGEQERTILVATSGDTGSAVALGFLNVPGINVVLLYPSGKVSEIQEKQLTTVGNNVSALEVTGNFDE